MFTNKNVPLVMHNNTTKINHNAPKAMSKLPVLICKVNTKGVLIWATSHFQKQFLKKIDTAELYSIFSIFPDLTIPTIKNSDNHPEILHEFEQESTVINYYEIDIQHDNKDNEEGYLILAIDKTDEVRERKTKELLLNIAGEDKQSKDLKGLFRAVQKELSSVMDTENLFIVLWDKLRHRLTLPYFKDNFDSYNTFPHGKTLSGHVIETGKPMLITEVEIKQLHEQGVIEIVGTPAKSWMGVPLKSNNEVLGLIAIQSYKTAKAYTRDHLLILEHISNQLALSIERKEYEEALKHSKYRAEQADKLKTSFLANMSHEIRTPMNSIVGFAELITRKSIAPEKKDIYAQYISNSSKALLALIDDIIDISKIESKQLNITKSNVFINKTLEELYIYFRTHITKSNKTNIELRQQYAINDYNFSILCDSLRLRQILNNLLNNAIKFTNEGCIKFGYLIPNNATILFYVKDTGIGMPQEKIDDIFERFRQIDDSTTRKYGGTGLGLAISKKLIQLMGGQIWVESEIGKGSTFYFSLPLIIPISSERILERASDSFPSDNLEGKTILIVEDEDTNYYFLQEVIAPTKAKVLRAINGVEAVQMVKDYDSISIVLMDIQLPVMSGYEATQRVKEIKPELPVVAQTAYAMAEDRAKGARAGCDDYLSKPIRPEDLLRTIKKYLVNTSND